jgi:hypothetical protein
MRFNLTVLFCIVFFLQSCIKEAPLNPEADIESFTVDPTSITSNVFIDQVNHKILLYLTDDAHEKGIAPVIKTSSGSKITPASGDSIHFDKEVVYRVSSEDGLNTKLYTVAIVSVGNWTFNFEKWAVNEADQYQYPVEEDGTQLWSSGNPGVALSGIPKNPENYPTHAIATGYLATKAAQLKTIKGTVLSELVGVRLFAGSLFLGNFNSNEAFINPLKATEFGQPYVGKPAAFTGYYKYTPGPDFQDENGVVQPGRRDDCSIYAVLYRGPDRLNATNIATSDKVVARAALSAGTIGTEFIKFELPFVYTDTANINKNMMVAIVLSSSKEGDRYRGAIGSTLIVDSLRVIPK